MTQGTLVRLDKLSEHNAGWLPTGYWLHGKLLEEPIVGRTLRVDRHRRARQQPDEPEVVDCRGLYVSSPVETITANEDGSVTCVTQNSVWRIAPLPEGTL